MFHSSVPKWEKLLKWSKDLGVVPHKSLLVKSTENSGIGVFFNGKVESSDQDIEILRVPQVATLNITTLRELTEALAEHEDQIIVKKVLNYYCQLSSINETTIILGYLFGFLILNRRNGFVLKQYLDILLETKVLNLHSDNQLLLEDFLSSFKGNMILTGLGMDLLDEKWQEFSDWIKDEFDIEITTQEILQLNAAVRSRTLEIPNGSGQEGKEEDDDEDFVVDVTLVPIIDFVNHDNDKLNAYFDVDKSNGDIILKLNLDKLGERKEKEEEFEIFITYSPLEDMNMFFMNYGFLPTSDSFKKVLEIPIFGYFNSKIIDNEKLNDRLYSLRQSPSVQFLIEYQDGEISNVECIADEFYSYFVFIDSIDWSKYESEVNEGELDLSEFESGYEKCYEIYTGLSEEELLKSQATFVEYLKEFFTYLKKSIDKFMEFVNEYELNEGETKNVESLLKFYSDLSIKFIKLTDMRDILLFEGNDEFLPLRLMPIYNFQSSVLDKEGIDIGELKI